MNKLKIKNYFILLLLLIGYSCLFIPNNRSAESLLPGKTGSYWKYKYLSYERYDYHNFIDWEYEDFSSFLFELDDSTIIWENSFRREISSVFNLEYQNENYEIKAYQKSLYDSSQSVYPLLNWLYHISEDGVYKMGGIYENDTMITKELFFPFPLEKGDSWLGSKVYHSYSGFAVDSSIYHECSNGKETLITPAHTFNKCSVISFTQKTAPDVATFDHYYQYYSPGIGLVCQVLITTDRQLTHYRVEYVLLLDEWIIVENS